MGLSILLALGLSSILYLGMGYILSKGNRSLGDVFPLVKGMSAKVITVDEFGSSATATTISLATIILAYFELASIYGVWLVWTAITSALGMLLVASLGKRIWIRLSAYSHRPTIHEFIGTEYSSPSLALIASLCTTVGFILIFATELIVGSTFLAGLVPSIPEWLTVIFLCSVGVIYTFLGGFRVVIETDQYQMKFIWLMVVTFAAFIFLSVPTQLYEKVVNSTDGFVPSWNSGLLFFLVGIAVMNIPTHISNMSFMQRVSGTFEPDVFRKGVRRSAIEIFASWALLALTACAASLLLPASSGQSLLPDFMRLIAGYPLGLFAIFLIALGLYGAMLSTASTNLIVVAHTISEDMIARNKRDELKVRLLAKSEFDLSRGIVLVAGTLAIVAVAVLRALHFTIADLVFSIYGGSLSLAPLIIYALLSKHENLAKISRFARIGVIIGFFGGWSLAFYGKLFEAPSLVFLSPAFSMCLSGSSIGLGIIGTYFGSKSSEQNGRK